MTSSTLTQQWLRRVIGPYADQDRVYGDVDAVLGLYPTLRPKTAVYTYDDGREQLLLCIHGLLPITFRGAQYNIPIAVWLTLSYPRDLPIAYVVPTSEMLVRPGRDVDVSGRLRADGEGYLGGWARKSEGCDLKGLLEYMRGVFGSEPPLYAKPKGGAQPPAPPPPPPPPSIQVQQQAIPQNGPPQPPPPPPLPSNYQSPVSGALTPAYTPDGRPILPPKPVSAASSIFSTPQQESPVSGASGAPPFLPNFANRPPPALPGSNQTSPPRSASDGKPPPPPWAAAFQSQSTGSPHPASGLREAFSMYYGVNPERPPPPPPPSSLQPPAQHVMITPLSAVSTGTPLPPPALTSPPPPPFVQSPAVLSPAPPPPHQHVPVPNLMDGDDDPSIVPSTTTITTPAPPRPMNPELLRLHESVRQKIHSELSTLQQTIADDSERLRATQADLLQGEPAIKDEMARLVAVRDVCRSVGERVRGVVQQAEKVVEEVRRKGDPEVDEVVCSSTIVFNQLINLVAEDNAIEDTMYHLHRALNSGRVDLDRFIRTTRVLAEEQFMKRALILKITNGISPEAANPYGWS